MTALSKSNLPDRLRTGGAANAADPCAYVWVWRFFVLCLFFGNAYALLGENAGLFAPMLAIGGAGGCAWAWLFTRALFRRDAAVSGWPLYLVGATVLVEGGFAASSIAGVAGEGLRLFANAASFVCVSLLALVFVEALSGYSAELRRSERRFRMCYLAVFGGMLSFMMLWVLGAPEGSLAAQSQASAYLAFFLVVAIGGRAAVAFRNANPLLERGDHAGKTTAKNIDPSLVALAARIETFLDRDEFYTRPGLKVADLSVALGEPDYRISQVISGVMEHANFNRLINARRIAKARIALADPERRDQQILAIALDCGFNSIGPFNRAFKNDGMTPRDYRTAALS